MKKLFFVFLFVWLGRAGVIAQTMLSAEALQKDFEILQKSYEQMHPGLYKYQSKAIIDKAFKDCKKALSHDQTLAEAYLNIHKLTSSFKCGHAYPNFFNQEESLKKEIFEQTNALPFHFKLINDRMLVTKSVDPMIKEQVEIKKINGVKVDKIIKTLLPIVRADGSNDGKRRSLLENGKEYFDYFDIFYPLFFPMRDNQFSVEFFDFGTQKTANVSVGAVNHAERDKRIRAKYPSAQYTKMKFEWLDTKTAVMTINDFENFDKKSDFGGFYLQSLEEYQQKKGKNLIIDVRENEGGNSSEMLKLVPYLSKKPIEYVELQNTWATLKIDTSLERYVDNKRWAFAWFNQNENGYNKLPNGHWKGKGADKPRVIAPAQKQFEGDIYLLSSPTNSSATYMMVELFKKHQIATIVGQTTGGNQKGVTAGAMFFMLLPHSKIEVDVPLIGTDLALAQHLPDAGISPDVLVKPSIKNELDKRDAEIETVKNIIVQRASK